MLRIVITAPTKAEAMRAARLVQMLYATGGKIVRLYDGDPVEETITRADVVVIAKQEIENGK